MAALPSEEEEEDDEDESDESDDELELHKGGVASDYEDLGQLGQDEPASMRVEPSNGSNVIPRRARPGTAGLGPPGTAGLGPQRGAAYRGTSLIRNNSSLGPYSSPMPREGAPVLAWWMPWLGALGG